MNWNKIKKECLKAWKLLNSWKYEGLDIGCMYWVDKDGICEDEFGIRDLYDFFDEQGVYIEIGIDKTMEAKFCYEISQEIDFEWNTTGYSDLEYNRHKTEEVAFLKAFKILEQRLKE